MLFKCVLAFQQIQKKKQKNPYSFNSFSKLLYYKGFCDFNLFNEEPVKIRWNLFAGGDFSTLKKNIVSGLNLL